MLSKRKKTGLILILSLIAISIEVLVLLYDQFYGSEFAGFLFDTGLTRWGWAPASMFAIIAITGTLYLKPGNWVLQLFMILVSVAAFLFSSYWALGLYVITHLKP